MEKESVKKFDLEAAFKALDEIEIPQTKGIKANRVDLKERFGHKPATEVLVEDYYDVSSNEDLEDAKEERDGEIAKAKLARIEKIVDLNAEKPEDLLPSYVGKVIMQCPQCMTLFYKNPEDIEPSEENPDIVNLNEPCQHCGNTSGYNLIGKVGAVTEDEADKYDETSAEENENELDLDFDKGTEEVDAEGTGEGAKEMSDEETKEDSDLDLSLEEVPEEEPEEKKKEESLKESKTTKQHLTVVEPGYQYKDEDGNLYTLYGDELEEDNTGIVYDWEFVDDENGDIYIRKEKKEESLKEAIDKDLDAKLKAHNEYIDYLKKMIEQEEKALSRTDNEYVKKAVQRRIDAFKADLEDALPEDLKNEVEIDLPTAEEIDLEATENVEEPKEETKESLALKESVESEIDSIIASWDVNESLNNEGVSLNLQPSIAARFTKSQLAKLTPEEIKILQEPHKNRAEVAKIIAKYNPKNKFNEAVKAKTTDKLCSVVLGDRQCFVGTKEECEKFIKDHESEEAAKEKGGFKLLNTAEIYVNESLKEYWWEDNDPMNWSDKEPLVYSCYYNSELLGYLEYPYMGREEYPTTIKADIIKHFELPKGYNPKEISWRYIEDEPLDETKPLVQVNESLKFKTTDKLCSVVLNGRQYFAGTKEECEKFIKDHKSEEAARESGGFKLLNTAEIYVNESLNESKSLDLDPATAARFTKSQLAKLTPEEIKILQDPRNREGRDKIIAKYNPKNKFNEGIKAKTTDKLCSVVLGDRQCFVGTKEECEKFIKEHESEEAAKEKGGFKLLNTAEIYVNESLTEEGNLDRLLDSDEFKTPVSEEEINAARREVAKESLKEEKEDESMAPTIYNLFLDDKLVYESKSIPLNKALSEITAYIKKLTPEQKKSFSLGWEFDESEHGGYRNVPIYDNEGNIVGSRTEWVEATGDTVVGVFSEAECKEYGYTFPEERLVVNVDYAGDAIRKALGADVTANLNESDDEESEEEVEEPEFNEDDIDELDEDSLNKHIDEYLKEVYSNVKSYKTTGCELKEGKLIVEGKISFNSGKEKLTMFEFLPAYCEGKLFFEGYNKDFSEDKAFTLNCSINKSKKLITESFGYKYKINKNLVKGLK